MLAPHVMTRYVSPETVLSALQALEARPFKRTGRTSAMGWLTLKAKESAPGALIELSSTGANSVEGELKRFFRVAPGTAWPDINPFGKHNGRIEYLAPDYERRGTYTHLYEGRNLASLVEAESTPEGFKVRVPESAAAEIARKLGGRLPLEACAAFFMRNEAFDDNATSDTVVERFLATFHITKAERAALFENSGSFLVELSKDQFVNALASLPPALQPPAATAAHSATARASVELVPLIKEGEAELVLEEAVRRRARLALSNSRAVALAGPPGTAKSALWDELLAEAGGNPSTLGLGRPPKFLRVTAEVDWTARTIIGGHYPDEDGRLVFRKGFLLQAIENDQILWIDELNRADLDRVLGPVFTFLAGQSVDLGPTEYGPGAKQMILAWSDTPESGSKEDAAQRVYFAGRDWRLIATYNNVDRGRVFPMGSALTRRWAIVPVQPIGHENARTVLETLCRTPVADLLSKAYEVHLRYLAIGLAPFVEIARYVSSAAENGTSAIPSLGEQQAITDGYVLYMGQQLARLDPEQREEFFGELAGILGPGLTDELQQL